MEKLRRILTENGGNPNAFDDDGIPLIVSAAMNNCIGQVHHLLMLDADVNLQNRGINALMYASSNGLLDIAQLLIATGEADVNLQNKNGFTALMLASTYNNVEIAQVILETGKADVTLQNMNGNNALTIAAFNGHVEIVRLLVEEKGVVNINFQNRNGSTALMSAASDNNIEIVSLILETGRADVTVRDINGSTALDIARIYAHDEIHRLLIRSEMYPVL